jgi:tetratricopeptide (TPR) repeat protein
MRSSREAEMDRALAQHYRAYRGYFTDSLDDAVATALDAERRLLALEQARPNDPVVLFTLMWNAYVGYGAASGLPARAAQANRFLDLARSTSERLLQIEPNDSALKAFSANVRQMQSQTWAAEGRHREALGLQREVVALFESAMRLKPKPATLNRLSMAEITLGNIAVGARDGALACASYRAADGHMAGLRRRGELIGSVAAYGADLAQALARCARGAPVGEFEPLDASSA